MHNEPDQCLSNLKQIQTKKPAAVSSEMKLPSLVPYTAALSGLQEESDSAIANKGRTTSFERSASLK